MRSAQTQNYPEFSALSGRSANHFSSTAFGKEFIYHLTVPNAGIVLYRVDSRGAILDSVSIPNSMGTLATLKDRLYFSGVEWDSNDLYRMRQVFMEFDTDLNVTRKTTGITLQPFHSPILLEQTESIVNVQSGDLQLYQDTLLAFNKYLLVDSPQVFLGIINLFTKTGFDGTVYAFTPLPINRLINSFFVQNRLYVQGSAEVGPFETRAVLEFDSEGKLLRGIDYDAYGSGDYLQGALGGWHKGRFYFTYRGFDPTLPGCPDDNATIDVRDSAWTIQHRFKLPDCGYLVSGKMPFGFDADDNLTCAAPHESYKKIMVYKYSPDFQAIWKRELNFENESEFYFPLSQHSTEDGGILLNCNRILNGARQLLIFKLSASGDLVSSTHFTRQDQEGMEPLCYPNPTHGPLQLSPGMTDASKVQISTVYGHLAGILNVSAREVDLSEFPPGAYVLSFWNGQHLLGTELVLKR